MFRVLNLHFEQSTQNPLEFYYKSWFYLRYALFQKCRSSFVSLNFQYEDLIRHISICEQQNTYEFIFIQFHNNAWIFKSTTQTWTVKCCFLNIQVQNKDYGKVYTNTRILYKTIKSLTTPQHFVGASQRRNALHNFQLVFCEQLGVTSVE